VLFETASITVLKENGKAACAGHARSEAGGSRAEQGEHGFRSHSPVRECPPHTPGTWVEEREYLYP